MKEMRTDFDVFFRKEKIGRFRVCIPGAHNVANALAAISLGLAIGGKKETIRESMSRYRGVKRRFQVIGDLKGAKIVEDYAHHPTEIKATIEAARTLRPARLIAVFQPHRYSRTKSFYREFSGCFGSADEVILTDVYAASEKAIRGVGTKNIYDIMSKDKSRKVSLMKKGSIAAYLHETVKTGDIVLVMGAGDIGKTAHELCGKGKA